VYLPQFSENPGSHLNGKIQRTTTPNAPQKATLPAEGDCTSCSFSLDIFEHIFFFCSYREKEKEKKPGTP